MHLDNFDKITISSVKIPTPDSMDGKAASDDKAWDLAQLFEYLQVPLKDEQVRALMTSDSGHPQWSVDELKRAFDKLDSTTKVVHPELQLFSAHHSREWEGPMETWLGTSQESCFLCSRFVRSF